jgi:hypothetical protein
MLKNCTEQKYLSYFEDYEQFVLAKWVTLNAHSQEKKSKRHLRSEFVTQVSERRVAEEL